MILKSFPTLIIPRFSLLLLLASHFFGHFICLDAPAPGMLGWVAGEMSHTTQGGNAEKIVVVLRNSPTIIVPHAEGHQKVCGRRLEPPREMWWPWLGTSCGTLRSPLGLQMGLCSNNLVKRQDKGGKDTSWSLKS